MPRLRPLSEGELFAASRTLREVSSLEDWNRRTADCVQALFQCDASTAWNLTSGRLQMATTGYGDELAKYDVEGVYGEYMRLDPAALRAAGLTVTHIADIYRQFSAMGDLYTRYWAAFECDHQLCAVLFEDDVFAGVVCGIQKLGSGDFTQHDVDAMHALHPHLQAGYLACAAFSRTQWFGAALAAVVDEYETPLFIVTSNDELPAYANRAARRLMQSPGHEETARIPVAAGSRTAAQVVSAVKQGRRDELPGLGRLEVIELPDWPRLGLERPRLVLVRPRMEARPPPRQLTQRQLEVISAAAAVASVEDAAKPLGVTVATLQTHLKAIYRALGVSNLSEALVSIRLGCEDAELPSAPQPGDP